MICCASKEALETGEMFSLIMQSVQFLAYWNQDIFTFLKMKPLYHFPQISILSLRLVKKNKPANKPLLSVHLDLRSYQLCFVSTICYIVQSIATNRTTMGKIL